MAPFLDGLTDCTLYSKDRLIGVLSGRHLDTKGVCDVLRARIMLAELDLLAEPDTIRMEARGAEIWKITASNLRATIRGRGWQPIGPKCKLVAQLLLIEFLPESSILKSTASPPNRASHGVTNKPNLNIHDRTKRGPSNGQQGNVCGDAQPHSLQISERERRRLEMDLTRERRVSADLRQQLEQTKQIQDKELRELLERLNLCQESEDRKDEQLVQCMQELRECRISLRRVEQENRNIKRRYPTHGEPGVRGHRATASTSCSDAFEDVVRPQTWTSDDESMDQGDAYQE